MSEQTIEQMRMDGEKALFIDKLAHGYSVTGAARAIKKSRQRVYQWRDEDPEFREAWKAALPEGIDTLQDEARRRAVDGVAEPIIIDGQVVGQRIKYSDTLLMFLLKALDRAKFGDSSKIEHSGHLATSDMSDEKLNEEILKLAASLKAQVGE